MHYFGIVSSKVDPSVVPKARCPSGGYLPGRDTGNGMFLIEGGI